MKKFYFFVLVMAGLWYYATHIFQIDDVTAFAQKNHNASWAPAAEYTVGLVYYQRDEFPKAQAAFTQFLTEYPTGQYEGRALLRLSEVAEDNHDYATEKTALDQYLADFPDGPDRQTAEKRRELINNR
jgi:outer membrane protein assembly factor BamD (BamD/ComL family)